MKLKVYCMQCASQPLAEQRSVVVAVPLQESNIYRFTCNAGHDGLMLLQQQRFQLLAEVATQAIVDGYFREAVTSFNGCLERFMEFACKVVVRRAGITADDTDKAWKAVSGRSERQAGMFAMALLLHSKAPVVELPQPCTKLRNDVVHKGYLPAEDEAIQFGQAVINLIHPVLSTLIHDCQATIDLLIEENDDAAKRAAGDPEVWHTHIGWSLFELSGQMISDRNLLGEVDRRRAEIRETTRRATGLMA